MTLIADILLAAGALGAAFYCFVLGRRLRKFNDLEKGMGGAVAVLSAQVDDLEKTLASARKSAAGSTAELEGLTARAETVRRQLELQIAALHDMVPAPAPVAQVTPAANAPATSKAAAPAPAAPTSATPPPAQSTPAAPPAAASTPAASSAASAPLPEPGEPMFVRHRSAGRAAR